MDELGHILRQARENKGLTPEEVQEEIRINARYIEAMEESDYDALPSPVQARGFLRNYARFLGLDPVPILERYQLNQTSPQSSTVSSNGSNISPESPLPNREDQPFFDPVNVEVAIGSRRDPESTVRLIIIAALIIAVALIANRFIPLLLNDEDGSNAITESVTGAVQSIVDRGQGIETDAVDGTAVNDNAALVTSEGDEEPIISTSRTNEAAVILPTPTPTRPALPATLEEIALKLEVTERTWMEVTIDEDVVYSGIARAGDAFEWTAEEEAKVLTGNAIGIYATINETPLGRLGGRGENKEEIWRTTQ